ncbi:MAG: aminotransferase class I/II-fold pyridoxal phosphate-dependent enzyme [Pseudomonadota bacterium]|nr:aminotransferase class I/II-fold pyridoxal phosphate-dependent enzyme [Pseudomonadota bacterium]
MARTSGGPIAIVGMACRFPGAPNVSRYWQLIREGRHAFGPPPADRWSHEAFFSDVQRATDRYYAPHGAFVDDVRSFAALEFGIPPRRVEVMDPQQRFVLEAAWHALQDAGYAPAIDRASDVGSRPGALGRDLNRRRVGTFLGLSCTEYRSLMSTRVAAAMMASGDLGHGAETADEARRMAAAVNRVAQTRAFSAAGALGNMSAAVVAQELDLGGPTFTVDAACASALVAIHDAVTYLRDGQIDAALAGGVYLNLSPENLIAFSRIGAISAKGVCRPFDAEADGFVQGEGVGMVMLKRLEDAVRDHDRVYAVIRGSGCNNDGRGDGPMSPRAEGQEAVIAQAWADAGITGDQVGYVEAHGTGTSVGDKTELGALRTMLAGRPDNAPPVPLGSAKANIGHTMSAAGIAGLIKAVLALHHKTIPPLANWITPHPLHQLDDGTFSVPTAASPWRSVTPRRATVSSFGFGGTNGHVVLEEAPAFGHGRASDRARGSGRGRIFVGARPPEPLHALPGLLVVTSADNGVLLGEHCAELAATVGDAGDLASIAHTINLGRKRRAVRVAIVARSVEELAVRLQKAADALAKDPLTRGALDRDTVLGDAAAPVPVAFLCPGQGMQKVGMLRDWLYLPDFAESISASTEAVLDLTTSMPGGRPLTDYIWAPEATEEALTDTQIAQPAMFAIGIAVAAVLARYGVTPAIVLGHSLGEFTAAALAGGASVRDTLRFVTSRGKAMSAMPGDHGAMAAVMATAEEILPHLPASVVIANRNHPRQNVISGPTADVDAAILALTAVGLKARRIPVSHAFHSPMLESVQPDVDRGLGEVTFAAPTIPMASCIAALPPTSPDAVRAIFARHATSPVEYVRGLRQCWDAGARIFVQLGSGATLTAFARGVVHEAEILSVASDAETDGLGLLRVLARLAADGHRIDLTGFGEGLASLPPTPFSTQSYWVIQDTARASAEFVYGAKGAVETASAPVAAEVVDASPDDDLRARVLRVVSKVSAFPLDALRVEQRLLDDLGFDSLMLAELSTKLGEAVPGFTGIPRSLFATSPTVADLVRHIEGAEASTVALTEPDRELVLYRPVPRLAPLSGYSRETTGRVLVSPTIAALRGLSPGDLAVSVGNKASNGLAGFVRSLAREWPDHKVVVVYGTESDAARELAAAERDLVVSYVSGIRSVIGLEALPAEATPTRVAGQRILVSGGTGWLGQVLAKALVDAGAEVVLLGSRQDPGDALANLGASARYVRADVRDVIPTLDGIDGIVHAAGVLADGPVGKADGGPAWDIKVNGLTRLVDACPGVKWVSAIGSYAAFFGNAYQTEYAAANDALVGVARSLSERGISAQVQVWGPWAESTMVGTVPLPMRVAMREDGVVFVDTAQGARAFLHALGTLGGSPTGGEVVIGLDLPEARRSIEVAEALSPDIPWLRDHALMGRPTVPMAMVLEWAVRLGAAVGPPGGAPIVRDLTLYDGVIVEKPLVARLRLDGDRFRVLVGSKLAWEGRIGVTAADLAPPDAPVGGAAAKTSLADFYSNHTFHGPVLQGIVAVGLLGEQHVTGKVRVGASAAWGQDGWTFSPLAIDSTLQLCGLWAFEKRQRAGFPVKVRAWTQRPSGAAHVTPDEVLDVAVTFEANTGDRFTGTVVLRRANGEVVAIGEGVEGELRALPGELAIAPEFTDFARFPAWIDLDQRLQAALMLGIDNPYFKVLEGTARDVVEIAGKERVHFSGYNYLGFSGHPYVEARVMEAVRKYGTSVSASRVASGERPIHLELEQRIAKALGVDDAIVFTAGHATNVTTVGHLFGPKDLILHDELIHDSVFQGMKLSGATRRPFPHGDSAALARLLEQLRPNFEKTLIVIEGVYSMDGDMCDLPAYVALKKRHKCFLMVDEAHSFGVVGERGYGVSEHFGVPGTDVDIWMGTLSKSLSSCGGYIAGSRVLVQMLKYTAPGFIYSAGLSPANTMAAIASLELMEREPENVKKLQANARFFYVECQKHGLDTGPSAGESGVCPVIVGNSFHALLLSDALMKRGVNVQPILYPAVADNASRLRFFLSSLHSEAQLGWTAGVVAEELAKIRAENG